MVAERLVEPPPFRVESERLRDLGAEPVAVGERRGRRRQHLGQEEHLVEQHLEPEPEGRAGDGYRVAGGTFARRQPPGREERRRDERPDRELHPAAEARPDARVEMRSGSVALGQSLVRRRHAKGREHLPLQHLPRKRTPVYRRSLPLTDKEERSAGGSGDR